mgnify:CR=1 FL=1
MKSRSDLVSELLEDTLHYEKNYYFTIAITKPECLGTGWHHPNRQPKGAG